MKRSLILLVTLGLIAGLIYTVGCTDEDEIIDTVDVIDPDDSTFIESIFGLRTFANAFQSIPGSLALLDSIPGAPKGLVKGAFDVVPQANDSIIITSAGYIGYSDGWHTFAFEATVINLDNDDTTDIIGHDSLKVWYNGAPVQYISSPLDLDTLEERAHASWSQRHKVNSGKVHHNIVVSLIRSGADTTMTIRGSSNDSLFQEGIISDDDCSVAATLNQVIDSLQFVVNVNDSCPTSGNITLLSSLDVFCVSDSGAGSDTLDINSDWTVTATANGDGTITIIIAGPIFSWTVTESCDDSRGAFRSSWGLPRE